MVSHVSGHLAYANSVALAIAGIGSGTPQPPGGEIERDERGVPTGLLKEHAAQELVLWHIPPYSTAELKEALGRTMRVYHQAGITSSHDAAVGYFREGRQVFQAYGELEGEGRLDLRIYLNVVEELYRDLPDSERDAGCGSGRLRLGCVKLFQDGSIQALTAALEELALALKEELKKREEKTEITAEWVLSELKKLAKVCNRTYINENGEEVAINPAGANRALELIRKHLGMYRDVIENKGQGFRLVIHEPESGEKSEKTAINNEENKDNLPPKDIKERNE